MAETSEISWTDATFNPWIGCTKVGPGCDHCYAEVLMDKRHHKAQWGAGQPRVRSSTEYWKHPNAWNRRTFYECLDCGRRFAPPKKDGFVTCPSCSPHKGRMVSDEDDASRIKQARRRVFCASLADVFDNEAPIEWFVDLLDLVRRTPNLDWLLLTKRIGNWKNRLEGAANWARVHGGRGLVDFVESWRGGWQPPNVWLGATVVNQEEADRDIPKLLAVPARVRFLSCEPLLGPLDLVEPLNGYPVQVGSGGPDSEPEWQQTAPPLDWVIAGGESGHRARPMHPDWARSLRDQCALAGVPFLFKQWGEWRPLGSIFHDDDTYTDAIASADEARSEIVCRDGRIWPERDGQPSSGAWMMERVGKKAAGRQLDGRTWDEFPRVV